MPEKLRLSSVEAPLSQLFEAAQLLSGDSTRLKQEVSRFLAGARAA
jgi:hypothetical protein